MKRLSMNHASNSMAPANADHEIRAAANRGQEGESTVVFLVTGAIFGSITLFGWLDGLHAVRTWLGL